MYEWDVKQRAYNIYKDQTRSDVLDRGSIYRFSATWRQQIILQADKKFIYNDRTGSLNILPVKQTL